MFLKPMLIIGGVVSLILYFLLSFIAYVSVYSLNGLSLSIRDKKGEI